METVTDFRHGRVPRAVRERQLLELAEELFAERGYEGTSMGDLARRAGVTKPVVYGIFGSKDDLLARIFERAGDELAAAMAAASAPHAGDLEATIRASARAFLHFLGHHERAWTVVYALDSRWAAEPHLHRIRLRQADFVVAAIGAMAPGVDAERARAAAYLLNGSFEALGHWRREGAAVPDEQAVEWLVAFTVPGLRQVLADA